MIFDRVRRPYPSVAPGVNHPSEGIVDIGPMSRYAFSHALRTEASPHPRLALQVTDPAPPLKEPGPVACAHRGSRCTFGPMPTEVWFRNPHNYVRELVECGEHKVAWDRGILIKKNIDPAKHALLYFGITYPFRLLLIGEQGTVELDAEHMTMESPKAVYPTWKYGDSAELLEDLCARPVGQDLELCNDKSVPADERPVWGQEHRVVIIEVPNARSGPGRAFLRHLKELQEDYPNCIIHVHGLYGFNQIFGMGFRSGDVEPRIVAQKGKVILPSGSEKKYEHVQANAKWVTNLGFKPVDLEDPKKRCMYNIKSAVWAGEHYSQLFNFRVKGNGEVPDTETPDASFVPATTKSNFTGAAKKQDGDQFLCDSCSLSNDCKYYREGAVCSVPGAEPTQLSRFFKTRNADDIIDGLSMIVGKNAERLEQGIRGEEIDGTLDPEVSKMMGQVFDQGTKLAKLIDPNLAGGPKVNINVGQGGSVSAEFNPKQFVAQAVKELEARGIPREDITQEMIQGMLTGMNNKPAALQSVHGTVVQHEQDELEKM